jgi:hypothetical protein
VTEPARYDWETGEYIPPAGWTVEEDAWTSYYCPQCSHYFDDHGEIHCTCEEDEDHDDEEEQ